MNKKCKAIAILCLLSLLLVAGCRKTATHPEDLTTTAKSLLQEDQTAMEIFFNGDVLVNEGDSQEINGSTYILVNDDRFQSKADLETYLKGIYAADNNKEVIDAFLPARDGTKPIYVDSENKLYTLDEINKHSWPAANIDSVAIENSTETTADIVYTYVDTAGATQSAMIPMQRDGNGTWLLEKSHYQVIGPIASDKEGEGSSDESRRLYVYNPDTETFETAPVDEEQTADITPESIIDALETKMGVEIGVNTVTINGNSAYVDFNEDEAPLAGVGSAEETMILESISKTLASSFPEIKQVYLTVNGGDYVSSHYEFSKDEPYYEVQ